MPKSRFVESRRLRPLVAYCAIAFVVLLVVDASVASSAGSLRRLLVLGWMILFPVGGWVVWRRS